MKQEIIEMARQAGIDAGNDTLCRFGGWIEPLETFAKLVAAKEIERIIAENKPEIEKCNAYIKELEDKLRGKA